MGCEIIEHEKRVEGELRKHQYRYKKLVEQRTAEIKAIDERLQQEINELKRKEDVSA